MKFYSSLLLLQAFFVTLTVATEHNATASTNTKSGNSSSFNKKSSKGFVLQEKVRREVEHEARERDLKKREKKEKKEKKRKSTKSPKTPKTKSPVPSAVPSSPAPSSGPSASPSASPSESTMPSDSPSNTPSASAVPSDMPSVSDIPSVTPSGTPSVSAVPSNTPSVSLVPSSQPTKCPMGKFVGPEGGCVDTAAEACPPGSYPVRDGTNDPYCLACGCGFCRRFEVDVGVSCCSGSPGNTCGLTEGTFRFECLSNPRNFPSTAFFDGIDIFTTVCDSIQSIVEGNSFLPLAEINKECHCTPDSEIACVVGSQATINGLREEERCFVCRSSEPFASLVSIPENPDPCYWD